MAIQNFMMRKMTEQDIEGIMKIELTSFSVPWSRESYLSEIKNKFATYMICDIEGEIAAYGGIWVVFEEAHITNVAVAESYRGAGIGKALMLELEKVAREKKALRILLEVRPSNITAQNMYAGLGFEPTAVRRAYYSDNGEDAIVMTKLLF